MDVSSLSCDVCICAKQPQISFPSQLYKPTQPFTRIPSNVWGYPRSLLPWGNIGLLPLSYPSSRPTWVFLLTDSENRAETQLGKTSSDDSDEPGSYDPSLDIPIALRKGMRSWMKHSMCNYLSYSNLSPKFKAFTIRCCNNTKEHIMVMESPKWKAAIMKEMGALEKNKTWDLCNLPKGHQTVGCKWVSTLKYKSNGALDRYKARLVAKGFT